MPLDAAERAAVLAEYDRAAQEKSPANISSCGCILLVLGVLTFFGLPALLADQQVRPSGKKFVIAVVIVLIVAGLYLLLRGNRPLQHAVRRSEWAAQELQRFLVLAPEERRRAAVALLWHAHYSGGPYTASAYKPAEVASQIPDALDYVRAVEETLVAERRLYRVFTQHP